MLKFAQAQTKTTPRVKKNVPFLLVAAVAVSSLLATGCTTSGMFPPPPVFAKPNVANGSFLSKLTPPRPANPYAPAGGFNQPPSRAPLFSGAARPFGSRSGSC